MYAATLTLRKYRKYDQILQESFSASHLLVLFISTTTSYTIRVTKAKETSLTYTYKTYTYG